MFFCNLPHISTQVISFLLLLRPRKKDVQVSLISPSSRLILHVCKASALRKYEQYVKLNLCLRFF
jgi:hypothetical protein